MSAVVARPRPSAWAVVSLACGIAMLLAYLFGHARDASVMAERASQGRPGIAVMGSATALILWVLLSPIGLGAGIIAWVRSPSSRWLAGIGVLACATPWVVAVVAR